MPENMPEVQAQALVSRGIVPLFGISEAMDAAEAAGFIGKAWAGPLPGAVGDRPVGDASERKIALDEASAKTMLRKAGLNVPPGAVVATVTEAARTAEALGYPVALKALGVAHKSEAGAVRLNLTSAEAVESAAQDLLPLGSGLYVEKMIEGGVAELIVGITRDPLFGPVMTVGAGGILVELLEDSATMLLPASSSEIEQALRGLKLFPLLDGYRGRPKADFAAAVWAIAAIADFALSDDLEELDINPLIICGEGKGAWVADALMVRRIE
jgi:acyl-CoA synthetase (NDP forming)